MTIRLKRYRPKKEYIKKCKKAPKSFYKGLVKECINLMLADEPDILLTFPMFITFQEGWPKGIICEKTTTTNTYKVKVRKLLEFLNDKGYTTITPEFVVAMRRKFNREWKSVDEYFKLVDQGEEENDSSSYTESTEES